MHYYSFNIEHYTSHTARLSILEDISYRRLLDLYYLNERPLNGCITDVARDIGMQDHPKEVEYILTKYFTNTGDTWVNKRADEEIQFYHNKKKSASKAGKASGKARRSKAIERPLNDRCQSVEPISNQQSVISNQNPLKEKDKKKRFCKPSIEEITEHIAAKGFTVNPISFFNHYESNGWKVGKNPMKNWKAAINTWQAKNNEENKRTSKPESNLARMSRKLQADIAAGR